MKNEKNYILTFIRMPRMPCFIPEKTGMFYLIIISYYLLIT